MRSLALCLASFVAVGCSGGGTSVGPSSVPPSGGAAGGGGGNGSDGGVAVDGGGMPGGGGTSGGDGGVAGGGDDGGMSGGSGGGGDMGGGGTMACTAAGPERVAQAATGALGLAVDDTNVYFAAQEMPGRFHDYELFVAPLAGGTATRVGFTGSYAATYLTLNADAVFSLGTLGELERWPKDGSAKTVLAAQTSTSSGRCLADAGGWIYWCAADGIHRLPETGGAAALIAPVSRPTAIAFDDTSIFIVAGQHEVLRVGRDGGTPTVATTVDPLTYLDGVAVDATHVYAAGDPGTIWVADKRDGAPTTALATAPLGTAADLLVDGGHLYYRSSNGGGGGDSLGRVAVDGSGNTSLVEVSGLVGQYAIRGPYLYYTFENDSSVYRICK